MSELAGAAHPHVLGPGRAPTPFTADEIRRGCPEGRTILLRVDRPGHPTTYRVNHFLRCDEHGAKIARSAADADGRPIGDADAEWSTWHDLQEHASFPADLTEIAGDDLTSPLGILKCRCYTVVDDSSETVFWFAETIAGMPVKVEERAPDGTLHNTVTMVNNTLP